MPTGTSSRHGLSIPFHRERLTPDLVVAAADDGGWAVLSVTDQQELGDSRTQLGAIEIAIARLREAGGGELALHSRSGRVEFRTVTAAGALLPL